MKSLPFILCSITAIIVATLMLLLFYAIKPRQHPHADKSYYQLYLLDDSIKVYDGDRWVSSYAYDSSKLAEDMIKDNE